jgi:hypothetical protein
MTVKELYQRLSDYNNRHPNEVGRIYLTHEQLKGLLPEINESLRGASLPTLTEDEVETEYPLGTYVGTLFGVPTYVSEAFALSGHSKSLVERALAGL